MGKDGKGREEKKIRGKGKERVGENLGPLNVFDWPHDLLSICSNRNCL